jgi:hypothetical protein
MEKFKNIIGLHNVCGFTDSTHILLSWHTSVHITPMITDFFNLKKFHNVILYRLDDIDTIF